MPSRVVTDRPISNLDAIPPEITKAAENLGEIELSEYGQGLKYQIVAGDKLSYTVWQMGTAIIFKISNVIPPAFSIGDQATYFMALGVGSKVKLFQSCFPTTDPNKTAANMIYAVPESEAEDFRKLTKK